MHKYIMFAKDKIDEKNINIFDCLKEIKYIILLKKSKKYLRICTYMLN